MAGYFKRNLESANENETAIAAKRASAQPKEQRLQAIQ